MKVAVIAEGAEQACAQAVSAALDEAGHQVIVVKIDEELVPTLRAERPNICYIAAPGKHGESGTIQALLDFLDIPYVGATTEVCRNTYNKALLADTVRKFRRYAGESGPAWWPQGFCLSGEAFAGMGANDALDMVADRVPGGYPVAVKPAHGTQAQGVHKVESQDELNDAILDALKFDDEVIIEQWIDGVEISVAILGAGWGAHALPPVEIVPRDTASDLAAQRSAEDAFEFYTPIRLESLHPDEPLAQSVRAEIERSAIEVYQAFNVSDFGRVDLIWDGSQARVLEVDVCPSMAEGALFPMACEASGLTLPAVMDSLVSHAR